LKIVTFSLLKKKSMSLFSPGKQYSTLIDPLLRKTQKLAAGIVEEGKMVIDVACGNGTLAFMHASRAAKVTAIDLSEEMIEYAKGRAEARMIRNVEFISMDANDLSRFNDKQYDYATISMAIHQFELEEGMQILKELSRISKEIIIIDYAFPLPEGFSGMATRIIERIAGIEHNRNFKAYLKFGGLPAIIKEIAAEKEFSITRGGSVFDIAYFSY
jgi:ubiquinone/menaquinone biosynthesis C-methylase UbiE